MSDDVEALGLLTLRKGRLPSDALYDSGAEPSLSKRLSNSGIHAIKFVRQYLLFVLPSFSTDLSKASDATSWWNGGIYALQLVRQCLLFILPSFITNPSTASDANEPLRPTAWLDGLRGLAALAVVNTHIATALFKSAGQMWAWDIEGQSFLQLPIVCLVYKGDAAVALFFIISGFALSAGPVKLMNSFPRDLGLGLRKLASSLVRRPIRLFFPAWVAAMLVFFIIRLDLFAATAAAMSDDSIVMGFDYITKWPVRRKSILIQLGNMFRADFKLIDFDYALSGNLHHPYLGVLWTIPGEYRGSMHLFLTHLALFFVRRPVRIALLCASIVVAHLFHNFEMPLFWAGHVLAELAALTAPTCSTSAWRLVLKGLDAPLFLFGAFLASTPSYDMSNSIFYSWTTCIANFLATWTPYPSANPDHNGDFPDVRRTAVALGAIIMVSVINRRATMQRFLCWGPVRYLGQISFSLYLVHVWIVRGLGLLVWYRLFGAFGQTNAWLVTLAFAIGYVINVGIAVWIADIFWRTVDKASIWLGREFERALLVE